MAEGQKGSDPMENMHNIIRAQRRALGLTQEQMAERLGVSAPAVSKWEQGASYPDIALLPALARLLGTDVNALLGFRAEPDREQISRLLNEVLSAAQDGGIDAGMARAEEILREYPVCGALLFGLAATIEGKMITAGMTAEERQPYDDLLFGWYVRAAESDDAEAAEAAAHLLAARHLARGELEAAKGMMARLPREPEAAQWPLEVSLLLAQGEREKAMAALQRTLFRRAGDIHQILIQMVQAELDEGNPEKAQAIASLTEQFVRLFAMPPSVGHLAQLMPALARQDEEESIRRIALLLEALQTPWWPGECLLYEHAGLKRSGFEGRNMLGGVLREMAESDAYAFLRGTEAFEALLRKHGAC